MMKKQIEQLKAQRMRVEVDLSLDPEFEFFNGEKVTKKM